MSQKLCALFAAAAGTLALGAAASAQLSDPYLLVRATNAGGTGTFMVPLANTSPGPNGSTTFSLGAPEDIFDGPNLIATVTQLTSTVRPMNGTQPNTISLSFTFYAGSTDTTFEVLSTIFTFDPIENTAARATAGITITDSDGNGATSMGTIDGAHYSARYGANTFADLLNDTVTAGMGGSNTDDDRSPTTGFTPIAGATDMTAVWGFTLSANDQVGVTSSYFIVPAPGALALLGLGGLTMARRRR